MSVPLTPPAHYLMEFLQTATHVGPHGKVCSRTLDADAEGRITLSVVLIVVIDCGDEQVCRALGDRDCGACLITLVVGDQKILGDVGRLAALEGWTRLVIITGVDGFNHSLAGVRGGELSAAAKHPGHPGPAAATGERALLDKSERRF